MKYESLYCIFRRLICPWIFLIVAGSLTAEGGDAVESDRSPPAIPETQVTLSTVQTQFQATVVGKGESALRILTAAHCVAPEDVGKSIGIAWKGEKLHGRIVAVAWNPYYHPIPTRSRTDHSVRGVVGVDNAIVSILAEPKGEAEERTLQKIRPADMTVRTIPGAGTSQTLIVHIVDQFGEEHVVRAGNHLNPKCIAWGHGSYRVQPGDSGAGVFVLVRTAQGMRPIVIGNVSLNDDRGGIAPLVSRREPWVEGVLSRPVEVEDEPGDRSSQSGPQGF